MFTNRTVIVSDPTAAERQTEPCSKRDQYYCNIFSSVCQQQIMGFYLANRLSSRPRVQGFRGSKPVWCYEFSDQNFRSKMCQFEKFVQNPTSVNRDKIRRKIVSMRQGLMNPLTIDRTSVGTQDTAEEDVRHVWRRDQLQAYIITGRGIRGGEGVSGSGKQVVRSSELLMIPDGQARRSAWVRRHAGPH